MWKMIPRCRKWFSTVNNGFPRSEIISSIHLTLSIGHQNICLAFLPDASFLYFPCQPFYAGIYAGSIWHHLYGCRRKVESCVGGPLPSKCNHIYSYIYLYTYIYIYMYIFTEKEREQDRDQHWTSEIPQEGEGARERERERRVCILVCVRACACTCRCMYKYMHM